MLFFSLFVRPSITQNLERRYSREPGGVESEIVKQSGAWPDTPAKGKGQRERKKLSLSMIAS